ncbi:MAG: hypothetical protein HY707_06400 [Ignavibacteriae bacterium]|nr:hypothetical protein [Ignavibacteriota bacterium]
MKKIFILVAVLVLALSFVVYSQIPTKISYQGLLTTPPGAPVPDGNYKLQFRIYGGQSGGTTLWSETHGTVNVQRGTFNVILGSVMPLNIAFERELFVEVVADSGPGISTPLTFAPRSAFTSAPYALNAIKADSATFARFTYQGGFVDSARIAGTVPDNTIDSNKIIDNSIQRNDVGVSFKAPFSDTADYAKGAPPVGNATGDLTGTYPNPTINSNAITGAKIASSTILFSNIAANGATNGQVIKWNGSAWIAGDDSIGVGTGVYLPLSGGNMTGEITSNGDPPITMGKGNFGSGNTNTGAMAFVAGSYNRASGNYSVVSGGGGSYDSDSNLAAGDYSTIGGGKQHKAMSSFATIGGGFRNTVSWGTSTISGGSENIAENGATIGGGNSNQADGDHATIAGGWDNTADGVRSVVGGGNVNNAWGSFSTVSGGSVNRAGGEYSTVPGGSDNVANGNFSFAAGRHANAQHAGSFVWADATDSSFASTNNNQFLIRASGGVGINTSLPDAMLGISGSVRIRDGTQGLGRVLTSDANGLASWQDPSSGGSAGGDLTGTYPNPAIAASAVSTTKLADNAVTSTKIQDATIQREDVQTTFKAPYSDTADYAKGAPPAGTAGGDLTGTYPNPTIATGAVTSAKIATGAVGSTQIADGGVANADLANDAVNAAKIADGTIGTSDLANGAVTNAKLATDAVTSTNILNSTIQRADVQTTFKAPYSDTADYAKGAPPAGNAGGDLTGTYPNPTIASNAVTSTKLADGSVTSTKILDGTIQRANVQSTFKAPYADTSDYAKVAPPGGSAGGDLTGTYPNPTIAASAVTTAKLADGSVNSAKIFDGAVATVDMADGSVTSAKIADGTITGLDISTTAALNIASLTTSGNVGIGTTNPTERLEIRGDAIRHSSSVSTVTAYKIFNSEVSDREWLLGVRGGSAIYNSYGPPKGFTIYDVTGAAARLVIDTSGNVGIGTTSPSAKLSVVGRVDATQGYTVGNLVMINSDRTIHAADGTAAAPAYSFPGAAGTGMFRTGSENVLAFSVKLSEKMRITEAGNVGIGTTSPNELVDIVKDANGFTRLIRARNLDTGNSAVASIELMGSNNYGQWNMYGNNHGTKPGLMEFGTTLNHDLAFMTNYNERMRITEAGNVGIGTTTPGSKLQVNGNTAIGYGASTAGPSNGLAVSGNVGIGTTNPQGALDVSSTTGAFIVPRMTTAQRDALTAVNGMIIYNTTTNQFNFYENGAWVTK